MSFQTIIGDLAYILTWALYISLAVILLYYLVKKFKEEIKEGFIFLYSNKHLIYLWATINIFLYIILFLISKSLLLIDWLPRLSFFLSPLLVWWYFIKE